MQQNQTGQNSWTVFRVSNTCNKINYTKLFESCSLSVRNATKSNQTQILNHFSSLLIARKAERKDSNTYVFPDHTPAWRFPTPPPQWLHPSVPHPLCTPGSVRLPWWLLHSDSGKTFSNPLLLWSGCVADASGQKPGNGHYYSAQWLLQCFPHSPCGRKRREWPLKWAGVCVCVCVGGGGVLSSWQCARSKHQALDEVSLVSEHVHSFNVALCPQRL